jgi:hypothetical protein
MKVQLQLQLQLQTATATAQRMRRIERMQDQLLILMSGSLQISLGDHIRSPETITFDCGVALYPLDPPHPMGFCRWAVSSMRSPDGPAFGPSPA